MKIRTILSLISFLLFIAQTISGQNCNCTEYLYLNDTGLNYVEKFRINTDGSLTEVGDAANGMPWLNALWLFSIYRWEFIICGYR